MTNEESENSHNVKATVQEYTDQALSVEKIQKTITKEKESE